jgi:asparagine synthase (glutamine-hydrolysing)
MVMNFLERFNWYHNRSSSITGTIWLNGSFISSFDVENELCKISTFEQFNHFILKLKGHFTIIKRMSDEYWVATDPILRYPVFFKIGKGRIEISDDPKILLHGEKKIPDKEASLFFLQFGATFGNHTLLNGLSVFEPGTVTRLSEDSIHTEHYLKGYFKSDQRWEYTPLELKGILEEIFFRYINLYKDRPFVVPLTAGYDSRFILTMLKSHGVKNVQCFTWGRKNNLEMVTAKKVAAQLNYKYQFIEYDSNLIKNFSRQDQFFKYMEYAGNFTSMPYMQDYFAVSYLNQNQIIPSDAVFIPGHTGDVYSGSHQRPWFELLSKNDICYELVDFFSMTGFHKKPLSKDHIISLLERYLYDNNFTPSQFVDYWDINIRQARFVARSSSIFNYFGYDVILPLSDQLFINYFFSAPVKLRFNERLYRETLVELFFKPNSVDFDLKDVRNFKKDVWLTKYLKINMPQFFKKMYYPLKDEIFYREITKVLISELDKHELFIPDFPYKYNSFVIQWYLKFILNSDYKSLFL